jgi:plastocyanin
MYDDYFLPSSLEIKVGTTLRWTNEGKHVHCLAQPEKSWKTNDLAGGDTYSWTFTEAGTYTLQDPLYAEQMRMIVIVK